MPGAVPFRWQDNRGRDDAYIFAPAVDWAGRDGELWLIEHTAKPSERPSGRGGSNIGAN